MATPLASEPGFLSNIWPQLFGSASDQQNVKIKGTVVLQKKNIIDLTDKVAAVQDNLSEILCKNVKIAVVSSTQKGTGSKEGRRSATTHMDDWLETGQEDVLAASNGGIRYPVEFSVDKDFGTPGALLVESNHPQEFYLKAVTLTLPSGSSNQLHFLCNSWVYNKKYYKGPRIFFPNKVYLPSQTPLGLQALRTIELQHLQGLTSDNPRGQRQEEDRIYDYDVYNDLGNPDENDDLARPVLGGSKEYPYPRRCRTGRKATKKDPKSEQPTGTLDDVYIPRDEQFGLTKESDFQALLLKSFAHFVVPAIEALLDKQDDDFDNMKDVTDLYYEQGLDLSACPKRTTAEKNAKFVDPFELIRFLTDANDDTSAESSLLKYPRPDIIKVKDFTWTPDEEFARQTLAGLNPMVIERLQEFPPKSELDEKTYGPSQSSITRDHIENALEGLTVDQALKDKRLYIVDYHDVYLPYLERINARAGKGYASRSLFFLSSDGTLKPVAIELSLPSSPISGKDSSKSSTASSIHRVFTPSMDNRIDWELAKTHATINDAGVHQLVSHWLRTHACLEPFILATNRHISALHPLYVLLKPHFKNTMNINSLARKALINCDSGNSLLGGIIERSFTPTKYSMEMSSIAYKSWRFVDQGLPNDLIKRGMAEKDDAAEHGLTLTVKDYPYAVDGLDIWAAVEGWVRDYVEHYYPSDEAVKGDEELARWWWEIRNVGHGDKKDEAWWGPMHTRQELIGALTTLIWVASAHHAAVNFGQYTYAGYMPNKPTMGRVLIPEAGAPAHEEMARNPVAFYLRMVSSKAQAAIVMTTLEILSQHASDEEYLGQRADEGWTADEAVRAAFARFGQRLATVEQNIQARNADASLANRYGAVQLPYTLLIPSSTEGLTNRGIPNSISI